MEGTRANIIIGGENQLGGPLGEARQGLQALGDDALKLGGQLEGAGLRIGAIGLAANAGLQRLNLDVSGIVQRSISAEKALFGIATTAGINGDAAELMVKKWSHGLNQISRDTGQTKANIIDAFQDLVAKGVTDTEAIKMLEPIGRAATATGAGVRDLAVSASAAFSKMKIDSKDLGQALDIVAKAGDAGAFELKDMAQYFDQITSKSAGLGATGIKSFAQLAAAAQIARRATGDAAEATTLLTNFLDHLNASKTYKHFADMGIDLEKLKTEARDSGDFIGTMLDKIKEATGGDAAKIAVLFPNIRAGEFVRTAIRDLEDYKKIATEAADSVGLVETKFDTVNRSTAGKLQSALISLESSIETSEAITKIVNALTSLSDWVNAHPQLAGTLGIGIATTAVAGIAVGGALAGIGSTITSLTILLRVMSAAGAALLANPVVLAIVGVGVVGAALYHTDWNAVFGTLSDFWGKVKALFAESDAWLKKTFLNLNPLPMIKENYDAVTGYFTAQVATWKAAGANLITALRAGIAAKLQGALGIGEKISGAIDYLKNDIPRWVDVGRQAMQGLLDGIKAKYAEIIDRVKNLGLDMLIKIKAVIGMRSPAVEFYKVGYDGAGAGLEKGLLASEQKVTAAAGRLGTASVAAATATTQVVIQFGDEVSRGLTNALMRGFEKGKGFAQNFRDTLVSMFKTMVLQPVIEFGVKSTLTSLASSLGLTGAGSALAAAPGAAGGSSDLLSLATSLKNGYQAVSSFFTGGSTASAATTATTAVAPGATSALGTAATYLGSAAAGFVVGKMISGGYSVLGKSGNAAIIAGGLLGSIIPGVGVFLGAALGGVVNRLFGRKLKATGIRGAFGGDGFTGENYAFQKGGLLRKDKTTTSPLDAAMDESLDKSYLQLKGSAILLGSVFTDTSKVLDDFSYGIKLNFLGLNAEQSQALITGELTKMGDAMAAKVLDTLARAELQTAGMADSLAADVSAFWQEFARSGESTTDTLTRLSGSLAGVNGWLERTGMAMYATTLSAANMASGLVDLFGDMDKFNAALTGYTANYFTATERMNIATGDMTDKFTALGLALPGTTEELRALIEAQNLSTESGRETFAALVQLSGGFKELTTAAGGAALNGRTLMQAWQAQGVVVDGLIASFDRSAVSEANLGNAARTRYAIELALVKQIDGALQSTHQMFAATVDEMKFSTLDTAGKYKFLEDKSKSLETLFQAATDPAEIQRLAGELNQNSRDAWMLLTDEEKRIKLAGYEEYLNELDTLTKTKLEASRSQIKAEGGDYATANDAIAGAIEKGLEAAMKRALVDWAAAAAAIVTASEKPVKVENRVTVDVNVDMPANVEVGIA